MVGRRGDKEGEKEKRSGKRVLLGWRELVKGNAKERERRRGKEEEGEGGRNARPEHIPEQRVAESLKYASTYQSEGYSTETNPPVRIYIYIYISYIYIHEKHDRRSFIFPDLR